MSHAQVKKCEKILSQILKVLCNIFIDKMGNYLLKKWHHDYEKEYTTPIILEDIS